ncbi:NIPSNAP family protein [Nocardioides sp. zg-1228]|uniref:NIPSNAP family protein n=1 Tax=Nocardioides sp. zg-1228 TaxID=2763008 RepID=UPI001642D5C1|nr:NIPSNAP family protein [Nocardioides sp. zg-1228]MBC2932959.1 NIPSNAP family protein [Nocardioides sp. zg-1228]QSF56840.1 NIPSNAP family protein [Nocardioides sp. zg-1228]
MTKPPSSMSAAALVELRQYTLKPGARGDLVELFERELIEPQEAAGMRVGGVFLDRDDAERFVWFRGFTDMAARRQALQGFYHGPTWARFRSAANDTMLDSDDVLLLRPTSPAHPLRGPAAPRSAHPGSPPSDEWVTVSVYGHDPDPELARWLATDVHAELEERLQVPVATYRSEPAENDYPALPVRADNVFVWSAVFADEAACRYARQRLERSATWRNDISPALERRLSTRQHLRLQPTARSQHPAASPHEARPS